MASSHNIDTWIADIDLEAPTAGLEYTSREEAIAHAPNDLGIAPGAQFRIGRFALRDHTPIFPLSAYFIVDTAAQILAPHWHSTLVNAWQRAANDKLLELKANLDDLWHDWLMRNQLLISGYAITDEEIHTAK